ncbi:MAG TPA: glycosyltransferase [Bdellovibrionales bacterium]|nr:MAG: hypothetical protein A2Z97_09990 [Bdellovibrionales bacterium GWB1_52_6]OFZ05253.1 MAG: hypothetical protein A2X97_10705 [Bdellovibrionales bacterium GWA1_52_35]OFZ41510.1 MAG: hypothetical protein A2070_04265 [Bdellovibrionales bacterium GWC1_52_8]HAR42102.1 glycosyltransferase [Bdellovibrionales bacterium]HCM38614.1 glycosyltransferase [Bdellovibrionales bacterium]
MATSDELQPNSASHSEISPDFSVIVPIYNSANIFPELYKRLITALEPAFSTFEIIAVLDGCRDASFEVISARAAQDSRLKVLEFSRNFGHQAALTAGLNHARGKWVAIIDDDLEDPPEILPQFVAKAREGFDVVYGVRRKRKRSLVHRALYRLFYRISGLLMDTKIPNDAGDFCVMSARVREILVSMPENNRYLRGMRAWSGFKQTGVEYERCARFADESGYSLNKYFELAFNGIFSFSYKPLKYVTFIGVLVAILSIEESIRIVYGKLTGHIPDVPGWAYLTVAVLFLSGLQLVAIGIIGEYIARIYDEVKQRPKYIVKTKLNVVQGKARDASDWR